MDERPKMIITKLVSMLASDEPFLIHNGFIYLTHSVNLTPFEIPKIQVNLDNQLWLLVQLKM